MLPDTTALREPPCAHKHLQATIRLMGSGTGVNTAAVAQEACASGYYSAAGATMCTQASAGYYTTEWERHRRKTSAAVLQAPCVGILQSDAGSTVCFDAPSGKPSGQPTSLPTMRPTGQPTSQPTLPTGQLSSRPTGSPPYSPRAYLPVNLVGRQLVIPQGTFVAQSS